MQGILSFLSRRLVWGSAVVVVAAALTWYLFAVHANSSLQTLIVHPTAFAEQVFVSGTVVAAHDVDLGFSQSGRVSGVYASVGDHVAAGRTLAQTENGDLRAALAQKQAALQAEAAKLTSLKSGTRPEELAISRSTVASDEAALAQAKASLVNAIQTAYTQSDDAVHNKVDQFFNNPRSSNAQLSFSTTDSKIKTTLETERVAAETLLAAWQADVAALSSTGDLAAAQAQAQNNLAKISALLSDANAALNVAIMGPISQTTLAGYVTNVGTARANVNTTATALTSAISGKSAAAALLDRDQKSLALQEAGSTAEDIAGEEARVAAAAAEVESAQAQLGKTIIVAPFMGTVTRMDAKVGEVISPTAPQISMISDGLFQIDCYIPEVEIAGLSVGNGATTTLDAYGEGTPFAAKVVAIDPAETVVNGVSTYKTTLQFLNPDPRIRQGMTASVLITAHEIPNALVVPQGAVFHKNGHATVQLLRAGALLDVVVETGAASSIGNVQITSGLHDGDTVILNPNTAL